MLHGHSNQQLVSFSIRKIWAQDLSQTLGHLQRRAQNAELGARDWIASYLIVFWCLVRMTSHRPVALPIRKLSVLQKMGCNKEFCLADLKKMAPSSVQYLLSPINDFDQISVCHFFKHECLPGFSKHISVFFCPPGKADWPVQVLGYVPSPNEVLGWQQQGQRCISLLSDVDTLAQGLIDNKDPFKFALHDIEHAYHFFKNDNLKKGQIGFYKSLDKIIEKIDTRPFWTDVNFQRDFNYLISDMNSHCVHLTKTLHAILLIAYKKSEQPSVKDNVEFQSFWKNLFSDWKLTSLQQKSFFNVNLDSFTELDALTIEAYFSSYAEEMQKDRRLISNTPTIFY